MPDDLQIPLPSPAAETRAPVPGSYRPRPMRDGMSMRPALLGAAAVGGVLLLGLGGWSMMNRRPSVVPVIEADTRPIRVKPENPGGMQFAGADEGGPAGADRMAPAAEVPAPQALRAQMQPPAAPAAPPAPAAPEPVAAAPAQPAPTQPAPAQAAATVPAAPSPATPSVGAASPLPDTPARPAAPAARPAPPAKAGSVMVQLAAVDTEAAATGEWARLSRRLPDLLSGRSPVVQRAEKGGQSIFRVRLGGFADTAEAGAFCTKVRAKGANCTVASF